MFANHRTTLGALHLVLGLMNVIAAAIVILVLGGVITLADDPVAGEVLGIVMMVVAVILGLASLPALVAGYALLTNAAWARVAAIVSAFLNLTSVPLGTAVAIYTLMVAFHDER
ncbi:hypothetical protein H8E07_07695 [bacterium]|nr:hypothetical protein [bacterium]